MTQVVQPVTVDAVAPRGARPRPASRPRSRRPPAAWLPVAGVAVVVVAFPLGNVSVPGLGVVLILPAAAAAVAIATLTTVAARKPLVVASPVLGLAAGAVAAGALAVAAAPDAALALRLTGTAVIGLALATLTATACRRPEHWYALYTVLLVVGAGLCAAGLGSAGDLQSDFGGAVVAGRLTGAFVQPNELGAFAGVVAVLALAVLGTSRRPAVLLGSAAVLAVALPALALSLSRGAWLGALGGVLVLVACTAGARRRLAVAVVLAALAWAVVTAAAPARLGEPASDGALATLAERAATILAPEENPYDDRIAIWGEAVRQIEAAPVLGRGPGSFPVVAAGATAAAPGITADHAHSLLLTTAAESGLVGAGFLVSCVGVGIGAVVRVLRHGAHGAPGRAAAVAAALAVLLVQGAVDYPLRNAVLAMLTWLLVGLLVAATAGEPA